MPGRCGALLLVTVYLYTGPPGSGKTLHAVERGLMAQRRRGGVVANFEITRPTRWLYVPEDEMSPARLMEHALRFHREGREGEGLVIIDEAHRILNSRTGWSGSRDEQAARLSLLRFLAEHRHFGYDVLLIAQADFMMDKQVRALVEIEVRHVKLNQRVWWLPVPVFLRVECWYAVPKLKGKLTFAVWPIGRGRYDHMAMRRRWAAEFRVGEGLGPPRPGLSLLPTVAIDTVDGTSLATSLRDGA